MVVYVILLRLLHILGGVFWAGAIFFLSFFLMPTVRAAGPEGGKFMQTLGRVTNMSRILPVFALTTIVSGLLLFWRASGHLNPAWLVTRAGITLLAGAVAGVLAFFGPATWIANTMKRAATIHQAMQKEGQPPNEAQLLALKRLQARIPGYYQQLTVLMILAVLCMALYRVI